MSVARIEKERLELAGRDDIDFINAFFILFRTAQYTEVNNATYQTASSKFYVNFRRLVDEHGRLSVKVIEGHVLIRDRLVKLDSEGMVRARNLIDIWRRLGIGGVVFDDSLDNRQIDKFVYLILNSEKASRTSDDVARRLADMEIQGITLLGVEEKKSEPLLDEQKRTMMRRAARVTFFRAISVVEDAMTCVANEKSVNINKARYVVHSLIDQISQDESSLIELTNIRDFDEYTYAHSANVCVYSLTIGLKIGLDRRQLSDLGFAALFHDIGKIRLPEDLIRKPDIYDENDWVQMQKHPHLGAKTILRNMKFDMKTARAARVAFEHHINMDFTGYPQLQDKKQVNLFSRIVSITDTFDALRSGRVYIKKSVPPDIVLKKMMYQMTVKFDAFLLKLFVNIIGIYPPGTLVLLSTDELAVVSSTNSADLARPMVRIIGNKSGPLPKFIDCDLTLAKNEPRRIVRLIDPERYHIDIKSILLSDR
nr:HD domain-containing protein [candidate division Zixibacteria bacterium]